ncbi:FadR family transcriptional regulator [Novosphingobium sp. ERN07]|uniref:FadR/GntR family transcriptional regulator n=1 Tax=Novosphingobium sp. ERN07 TaxID=2726187 RepID=UPI0014563246|nr:GntR family transcriptional regulator [Novosphingobium sp. ERN07]NLR72822.1 FadR family transcriptional regulator [Novosphingobium sp. ERN07]
MSKGFADIPTGTRRNAEAVRVPKTAELVARQIRNGIIRGELRDGDTLPAEVHLIAEFEVSRPTIREAVRILESEGLVTVSRGARGGARISSPNYEMIARAAGITLQAKGVTIGDLYEMRTLIEPPAARMVAERNSKAAVPVLRGLIDIELALISDRMAVSRRIAEFHQTMIELAGNQTLIMVAQALRGLVDEHLLLAQRRQADIDPEFSKRRLRFGLKSHTKLVDLIEAEDGPGAEAHWKEHMIAAGKVWLAQIGPDSVVELLG